MESKMLVSEASEALGVTAQALHNQIKRKNLVHGKSRNRVYFSHDTAKLLLALTFSPQVISFQIVKGGTGKTSMCLAVGIRASLSDKVISPDTDCFAEHLSVEFAINI